jgi:hypothetical protein
MSGHRMLSDAPEALLRAKVKQEIRFRMRQVRKALPAAARTERSSRIHDALFARAGEPHRFEDCSPDFATWVIFYGPKGGEG